jgi:hypothetical protein
LEKWLVRPSHNDGISAPHAQKKSNMNKPLKETDHEDNADKEYFYLVCPDCKGFVVSSLNQEETELVFAY